MNRIAFLSLGYFASASFHFAAFADWSDIAETVYVVGQDGNPLRINKKDHNPEVHGETIPDPHAVPASPAPAKAPLTALQLSAAGGAAAADQQPAPVPATGYADPASRPYYVAQIGQRWFLTDANSLKFQKGQSAIGFDTQEAANAKAAELTAAEKV